MRNIESAIQQVQDHINRVRQLVTTYPDMLWDKSFVSCDETEATVYLWPHHGSTLTERQELMRHIPEADWKRTPHSDETVSQWGNLCGVRIILSDMEPKQDEQAEKQMAQNSEECAKEEHASTVGQDLAADIFKTACAMNSVYRAGMRQGGVL